MKDEDLLQKIYNIRGELYEVAKELKRRYSRSGNNSRGPEESKGTEEEDVPKLED